MPPFQNLLLDSKQLQDQVWILDVPWKAETSWFSVWPPSRLYIKMAGSLSILGFFSIDKQKSDGVGVVHIYA